MLRKAMLLGVFLAMVVCICAASNNTTSPTNISQAAKTIETVSPNGTSTAPVNSIEKEAPSVTSVNAVTVYSNIATKYYVELIPYPAATRRLSLMVDGQWRVLSGPSDSNLASVQDAFGNPWLQVTVWYSGTTVVGLVVSTK